MGIHQKDYSFMDEESVNRGRKHRNKKRYKISDTPAQVVYDPAESKDSPEKGSQERVLETLTAGISKNPNLWESRDSKAVVENCFGYVDEEFDLFVVSAGGFIQLAAAITAVQLGVRRALKKCFEGLSSEQQSLLISTIVEEMPEPKLSAERVAQLIHDSDEYPQLMGVSLEDFDKVVEDAFKANPGTFEQPSANKEDTMTNQITQAAQEAVQIAAEAVQAATAPKEATFPFENAAAAANLQAREVFPEAKGVEDTSFTETLSKRANAVQAKSAAAEAAATRESLSFTDHCLNTVVATGQVFCMGVAVGAGSALGAWAVHTLIRSMSTPSAEPAQS